MICLLLFSYLTFHWYHAGLVFFTNVAVGTGVGAGASGGVGAGASTIQTLHHSWLVQRKLGQTGEHLPLSRVCLHLL